MKALDLEELTIVFQVAHAYEKAAEWYKRNPQI